MTNKEKLKSLLLDIFLLEENEFSYELRRDQIPTWDSLGVVSVAVGIQETFHYHLLPEEATGLTGVQDIMQVLQRNGVDFSA